MTCSLCAALAENRDKPASQPLNTVIALFGLHVAPVPGKQTFESIVKGTMQVARMVDRSKPHAHATVVAIFCPVCKTQIEGALLECAAYGEEQVEGFLRNLRPLVDSSRSGGVVMFFPEHGGARPCQVVVWTHPKLGEGCVVATEDEDGNLGPWVKAPAVVAGAFWLSWDARKMWRGLAKPINFGGQW